MVYGFNGLRHHTIVCRDYQNDNVCDFRAARPHHCEGFMSGRIEENNPARLLRVIRVGNFNRVSAYVLCDAACFAFSDARLANRVKQRSLAVIHVTHDGHDRGTRLQQRRIVLFEEDLLGGLGDHFLQVASSPFENEEIPLGRLRESLANIEVRLRACEPRPDLTFVEGVTSVGCGTATFVDGSQAAGQSARGPFAIGSDGRCSGEALTVGREYYIMLTLAAATAGGSPRDRAGWITWRGQPQIDITTDLRAEREK